MELFVYTKAADLTSNVATTLADVNLLIAALADPTDEDNAATIARIAATVPQLVYGDNEELIVKFLSAASTYESWTIAGGYTVSAGLGLGTTDSTEDFVTTSTFTDVANGFSGRLNLDNDDLADEIDAQRSQRPGMSGARLTLQLAVTDSSSRRQTFAAVPIFVRASVL